MRVQKTDIEGVYIIEPKVIGDERGYFMEAFSERDFEAQTGQMVHFVQDTQVSAI